MSSVFKVSCAFYWVVWLICLSYAMGISYYEEHYVIQTEKYSHVTALIKLLCYLNVSMACVGCVFVKCDVTHILCCFCFMLPTALIVPGVSIYGVIKVRELSSNPPAFDETAKRCCGLLWYKDYKMFLYDNASMSNEDIPVSCCVKSLSRNCSQNIFNTGADSADPADVRGPHQKEIEERMYIKYTNKGLTIPIENKNITQKDIHMKGCFKFLLPNTKDVYQAHFTIFILILVCSLLMSLIYINNFCSYGPCQDSDYLHSLDVEEVPFLEQDTEGKVEETSTDGAANTSTASKQPAAPTKATGTEGETTHEHRNSGGFDKKAANLQKQANLQKAANPQKTASLHPSVVESLKNNRLRKYL